MSDNSIDQSKLLKAAAIVAAGSKPTTSADTSRNTTPPVTLPAPIIPKPGPPAVTVPVPIPGPVLVPLITAPSTSSTAIMDQQKGALTQLVKTSKMSRGRGSTLAEKPEVQQMLDKDLFLIQSDRRTKMSPLQQMQLLRILSQFFLERVDDGHRYAYFEAVFLGRSEDPTLNEYRLSVMFQLVSFSIQYPALPILNHVMSWLSKLDNEHQQIMYSDKLIDMLVEHYVRTPESHMQEYLFPLETSCSEFCALFIARAPLNGVLNSPMIQLIVKYSSHNMPFILRHFRDTPWQGNDFAEKVVPKLVESMLSNDVNESDNIASCLCYFLRRWHIDVLAKEDRKGPTKSIEILDQLLAPDNSWTKRRAIVLATAIGVSTRPEEEIQKELKLLRIPDAFKPIMAILCSGEVQADPQKVVDSISEVHLTREMIQEDDLMED